MPTIAAVPRASHAVACLALAGIALAAAPARGAGPVTGDGEFTSRGFVMPVSSAIAYRDKSILDKQDVIIVAISNRSFDTPWIANFHDRRRVIEKRFKDKDTAVVYLEFRPDGGYRGHSFYFESGNGCGYCGGNMGVNSTVKVTGGKIAGTLKLEDGNKVADVKIDTPILSSDHGAALPPGGGDPGKAYMAYHDAMITDDPVKLRPHLSKANGKYVDDALKKGRGKQIMKVFTKEHPDKSLKIVRGWSKGDTAVLLFEGETPILRLTGEAVLVREGGKWLVDEELADVKLE